MPTSTYIRNSHFLHTNTLAAMENTRLPSSLASLRVNIARLRGLAARTCANADSTTVTTGCTAPNTIVHQQPGRLSATLCDGRRHARRGNRAETLANTAEIGRRFSEKSLKSFFIVASASHIYVVAVESPNESHLFACSIAGACVTVVVLRDILSRSESTRLLQTASYSTKIV